MNIGIPKERRTFEYRVGMTPAGVQIMCQDGHTVYVEHDAGLGAGFSDLDYEQAGARIVYTPHEVFGRADLLLKVARPLYDEIEWLRPGTAIAGLLHLTSARQDKIELMAEKGITSIAYEQIQLSNGDFPVRVPLSQIGGRLAAQIGARLLQNNSGGKGILLGGMPGIPPAEVVVIGAGVAGTYATRAFLGMGAHVTVMDIELEPLQRVYNGVQGLNTMVAYQPTIARAVAYADIVVSTVFVPGEKAPQVVTREMVRSMKPRSVIMDISIDEGGSVETARPTTHEHPTYVEEGIIHYCVPNIPSVVARSATYAFLNSAMPYIRAIANHGIDQAAGDNPAIDHSIVTYHGELRPRFLLKGVHYGLA
jgi:alanine dehydrogenase